jgi:hypothetical protein
MNYHFEQRGRRLIVLLAVLMAAGMTGIAIVHGAPWYFTLVVVVSGLMALPILAQNSHSGMRLEGDTLTLFKDTWRHVIDARTIRRVRTTAWTDGQPSVWLEFDKAPAYRLPGYCVGSVERIKDAFRQRGIKVD